MHELAADGVTRLAQRLVWAAGALVVALALLAAARLLVSRVVELGLVGVGPGMLMSVIGAGLVVAMYLIARPPMRPWLAPTIGILILLGVRALVIWQIDAELEFEPLVLHQMAAGVTDGECCFDDRSTGYPIVLGLAYAVFGVNLLVAELMNLVFGLLTGALVYDLVRVTWGRAAAVVALTAYALMPSSVLLTVVPSTETPYALALLAAMRLSVATGPSARVAGAVAAGAFLGLSQYIRPTSAALLPVLIAIPWLTNRLGAREGIVRAGLATAAFVIVLVPVLEYNLRVHGDVSVSTSAYGGWSLYVGTNQQWGGRWNAEDYTRYEAFPGDTWWDRSEVAGREGLRRITDDPVGFARLVVGKFQSMWGDDDYAIQQTIAEPGAIPPALNSVIYVGLVAAALGGAWSDRHRPRIATLLILGVTATVAVLHVFVEVDSRYHAYVIPLWCALAGAGVAAALGSGAFASLRLRPSRLVAR